MRNRRQALWLPHTGKRSNLVLTKRDFGLQLVLIQSANEGTQRIPGLSCTFSAYLSQSSHDCEDLGVRTMFCAGLCDNWDPSIYGSYLKVLVWQHVDRIRFLLSSDRQ